MTSLDDGLVEIDSDETNLDTEFVDREHPRFISLELTNFLSYKQAKLEFGEFIALVGPNASGKSNLVAAIKLLREIPTYGLQTAIARRGGFDQLRHRSAGRPYDPAIRLTFAMGENPASTYELRLGAVKGQRYKVKKESADVYWRGRRFTLDSDGSKVVWTDARQNGANRRRAEFVVAPGQSAISTGGLGGYVVYDALQMMQTVEVNPAKVADLQEPSSTREFDSDGSNVTSIYENLDAATKRELVDELAAIVPGIESIEVARLADRQTLRFRQRTESGIREFYAKQMSDGTLRALAILLAALQRSRPGLLVIEEPEVAIHLGALRTLVELLQVQSEQSQILITTHSADIVDALPIDSIRIVWSQSDASHVAPISEHSKEPVRLGLITPGQLLRSDSLDPAI
ncbi:Predicted ATPase [Geodermatophilus telluris]|uniref:Predicted ATPase n=1 Tax=Geodermatophilus telluris TaxID=1190417 RepID=A0A1G6PKZ0_9ACTN|nr:AAA family ATPase [Geodermatophilus telluris]SDC80719.1 Predicted ATPase [Geodermatophilus telluris]